jgi:hypothetical protein
MLQSVQTALYARGNGIGRLFGLHRRFSYASIIIGSRYQRNGACFLPSKSQAYSFPAGFLK